MNIEDILLYVKNAGGAFIGYYPVSFPVYIVHVSYQSVDKNPFFTIYRAILQYAEIDPNLDKLPYFAKLIGFDYDMIKRCLGDLKKEGMIRLDVDHHYIISEDARRKYLIIGNRPMVEVSGSFVLDGKDLSLLPEIVYKNKRTLTLWDSNVSTHKPIDLELSQDPAIDVVKKLSKSSNREKLGLESTGTDFKVLEFDKRFLKGAAAVFYIKENQIIKEIIYQGEKITCTALDSPLAYSIDMCKDKNDKWFFKANLGYNVARPEDMSNTILFTQNEGWSFFINSRYGIKSSIPISLEIGVDNGVPKLTLDETILLNCSHPRLLLEDADRGYIDFPVFMNSFNISRPYGLVRIRTEHNLNKYIEFVRDIEEWESLHKISGMQFTQTLNSKMPNWRNYMVEFEMFSVLEKIDCDCFIKNV